jgi:hypothetical protein
MASMDDVRKSQSEVGYSVVGEDGKTKMFFSTRGEAEQAIRARRTMGITGNQVESVEQMTRQEHLHRR